MWPWRQIYALLVVQLLSLVHALRQRQGWRGRLLSIVLGVLWYLLWTVAAVGCALVPSMIGCEDVEGALPGVLLFMMGYWQLAPLVTLSLGVSLSRWASSGCTPYQWAAYALSNACCGWVPARRWCFCWRGCSAGWRTRIHPTWASSGARLCCSLPLMCFSRPDEKLSGARVQGAAAGDADVGGAPAHVG